MIQHNEFKNGDSYNNDRGYDGVGSGNGGRMMPDNQSIRSNGIIDAANYIISWCDQAKCMIRMEESIYTKSKTAWCILLTSTRFHVEVLEPKERH